MTGGDLHSTCLNHLLCKITGAPCMWCHGNGVAGEGVWFDHAAGDAAPHEAGLGC
jgi:hypothetical protein